MEKFQQARVRANYPFVRLTTKTHASTDSRLSYGFVDWSQENIVQRLHDLIYLNNIIKNKLTY